MIEAQVSAVFSQELPLVLEQAANKLRGLFSRILLPKLDDGTQQGKRQAVGIAEKWGRKVMQHGTRTNLFSADLCNGVCKYGV